MRRGSTKFYAFEGKPCPTQPCALPHAHDTMGTTHVSVRLTGEQIVRVDAMAPRFSTRFRAATRSDILRGLILTALEVIEAEARAEQKAAKRRKGGRS
jgi:hypothetical protein